MSTVLIDSNLKANTQVQAIVDIIENKMVLDFEISIHTYANEVGVKIANFGINFTLLHMEYGEITKWCFVDDMHPHNAQVLKDNIEWHYSEKIA